MYVFVLMFSLRFKTGTSFASKLNVYRLRNVYFPNETKSTEEINTRALNSPQTHIQKQPGIPNSQNNTRTYQFGMECFQFGMWLLKCLRHYGASASASANSIGCEAQSISNGRSLHGLSSRLLDRTAPFPNSASGSVSYPVSLSARIG